MIRSTAIVALLLSSTVACSKKGDAPSRAADLTPAQKPAEPGSEDPPRPAAGPLVDHDLASRGAAWAGWTIKGPKEATVVADDLTFLDSSQIRWGEGAGAISFRQGKLDFDYLKKERFPLADTKIIKDTPDLIETTETWELDVSRCFYQNTKVAGVDVGCWTSNCALTDAELATFHQICDSLTKK